MGERAVPLLRVHGADFAGRDAAEQRVEPVDAVEETTPAHRLLAARDLRVLLQSARPSAVPRYLRDTASPLPAYRLSLKAA